MEMYHYFLNLVIREAAKRGESHITVVHKHVTRFKGNYSLVCKSIHVIFIQRIASHADIEIFSNLYTVLRNYCENELLYKNPNIPNPFHMENYLKTGYQGVRVRSIYHIPRPYESPIPDK